MNLYEKIQIDPVKLLENITSFLSEKFLDSEVKGAVFGLSGGLDSSCVAAILSHAIDKERILGLFMPEKHGEKNSEYYVNSIASTFGIKVKTIDITTTLKKMGSYQLISGKFFANSTLSGTILRGIHRLFPREKSPFVASLRGTNNFILRQAQAYYRIKNRIRMINLYWQAEQLDYLVVGSSNKSELMTGFFVKYGDSAADIMPLFNLYKTQIKQLAKYLGVPDCIINKPPTPGTIPGITDELALGLSYSKLDLILLGLEKKIGKEEIVKQIEVTKKTVDYIETLIDLSSHMRTPPEVCEL